MDDTDKQYNAAMKELSAHCTVIGERAAQLAATVEMKNQQIAALSQEVDARDKRIAEQEKEIERLKTPVPE